MFKVQIFSSKHVFTADYPSMSETLLAVMDAGESFGFEVDMDVLMEWLVRMRTGTATRLKIPPCQIDYNQERLL